MSRAKRVKSGVEPGGRQNEASPGVSKNLTPAQAIQLGEPPNPSV